jgi:hypothetical protein
LTLKKKKPSYPTYKKILLIVFITWITILFPFRLINSPLNFYGLVLDQDGKPIPDVSVKATILSENPLFLIPFTHVILSGSDLIVIARDRYRKTTKDGRFQFASYYGRSLSFYYRIKKDRYEFVKDGTPDRFTAKPEYLISKSYNWSKPDPKKPVIYRMRKLEEPTFVLQRGGGGVDFSAKNDKHVRCYDWVFEQRFDQETTVDRTKRSLTPDLIITSKWDKFNNRWAITFAPGNENGGIQISDKKLYTAPKDGYKQEITFYRYKVHSKKRASKEASNDPHIENQSQFIFLNESPDKPFEPSVGTKHADGLQRFYYFYLRSRNSELYSRIEIQTPRLFDEDGMRIFINVTINPYAGQRSLDLEPRIPYRLQEALEKEIKKAFDKDPNAMIPPPPKDMHKISPKDVPLILAEREQELTKLGYK